jgi:hypothetical protein
MRYTIGPSFLGLLLLVTGPGVAPARPTLILAAPLPATAGSQAAGTFADATGHSAQSHLVYAANTGVWWLFTLTSAADSLGGTNHLVKSFYSSGPDLATSTWTAGPDTPGAAAATGGSLTGGRSLGVAYLDNSPLDVVHLEISMALDGQTGRTSHIRGLLGANTIAWDASGWNAFDEGAATWTRPHANTLGVSNGKFLHSAGPILQQEVDANVRRSLRADTGGTWTGGFSTVSVIDGTMTHQNNASAFAPLAGEAMLAVYDNGQGTEPALTNLRYKRSNADGSWPAIAVGSNTGGDGDVFASSATIDQNDWSLVAMSSSSIYAFRRNAAGTNVDAAAYDVTGNTWLIAGTQPPPLAPGQSLKPGAGLFGATDGAGIWLFAIGTGAANSLVYTAYDGIAWSAWAAVPGTDTGTNTRAFIAGYPRLVNGQIGLIWTQGASPYDLVSTAFTTTPAAPDVTPPTVSISAPAGGSTVTGTVPVAAEAADDIQVAGVQFQVDGGNLGAEATTRPYAVSWDSRSVPDGSHTLSAIARDTSGNTAFSTVTVAVSNPPDTTPPAVSLTSPAGGAVVSGTITVSATATDNVAVAGVQFLLDGASLGAERTTAPFQVTWNTALSTDGSHTVSARARDASGNQGTAQAIVTVSNAPAPPAPAPVIDTVSWGDQGNRQTTVHAAVTTRNPGELLLAFIAADWRTGTSGNTTVTGVGGAGLAWALVRRTNVQRGTSEIWRALAPAVLTGATVTATFSQSATSSMTVVAFSGVDASGTNGSAAVGATASASASSGAPRATLVTTRANSWAIGVGVDFDNAIGRTPGSGQTMVHQYLPSAGRTYWVQRTTAAVAAGGATVVINDVAPTGDRYNLTICEVRAPAR